MATLGIVDALTSVKAADIPSRGFDSRSGPHLIFTDHNLFCADSDS